MARLRHAESDYLSPALYDDAFNVGVAKIVSSIRRITREHCDGEVHRVLEPACGTGWLLEFLARKGFQVAGYDLSTAMVAFARRRLRRYGGQVFRADMGAFEYRGKPFDAAVNLHSSFGHLLSGRAAASHLRATARVLRPGGVYLLGMWLLGRRERLGLIYNIEGRKGLRAVGTRVALDRGRRREAIEIEYFRGRRRLLGVDSIQLRTYTESEMRDLLHRCEEFEWVASYEFDGEAYFPHEPNAGLGDALFVLKRRS